jgi:hypothetical protein
MVESFDEVWYIDWNSDTRSLLYDIDIQKTGKLHHIVITPEIAKELTKYDPEAEKCCEVLARNIGIKRATGDWIISTNIDILTPLPGEMHDCVSQLDEKTFYTLSRRGVEPHMMEKYPDPKQWKEFRTYLREILPPREHMEQTVQGDNYSIINCCGDFQLAHRSVWQDIRGFEEGMIYPLYADTNIQKKAIMHGFGLKAIFEPPMFHIWHGRGAAGIYDGINKKGNDPQKYISLFTRTLNTPEWGFSYIDIEHEVI